MWGVQNLHCVHTFTKQCLSSGDPADKSAVAQQDRGVETVAVHVHGWPWSRARALGCEESHLSTGTGAGNRMAA